MTGNATHVSEAGIASAQTRLDDVGLLSERGATYVGYFSDRQDTSKWTTLTEASDSRTASSDTSAELVEAINAAASAANDFCRLVIETRDAFSNADEAGQAALASQYSALEDAFSEFDRSAAIPPFMAPLLQKLGLMPV
ncbi:hypothetical protein EG850_09555 [Gulosibacter macacae]|uniref:Uncharacterized protein n=1 Tax=Gulosibacter macacae TaxID=2488791 RepID=A0A3P3VX08_9MICO|nr:hypothetical protein [Gulosibacter macacae]RRJ86146.1 hypothetical protein EG850_09555 [Gulosibacter macacae]